MNIKNLNKSILIAAFVLVILIIGLFMNAIHQNAIDWCSVDERNCCFYNINVHGLSGKEVTGTTTIMVPIPATKDGQFLTPPSQKEPTFMQMLVHEYISHTPESKRKGPSFQNTVELFDNNSIGIWNTFIAETDDGYMLGFKTNVSTLEDIFFSKTIIVDNIDIFDPINNNSLILSPLKNLSSISILPYGNQMKYNSNPTYETYICLSDNLRNESMRFEVALRCHNDHTEWSKEYRGSYRNYIGTKHLGISTNEVGKIKVIATLEQEF